MNATLTKGGRMTSEKTERNHAEENAQAWAEGIMELYNGYHALENRDKDSVTIDGEEYTDSSEITDHVMEDPLSVEVRSDWHCLGDTEANEPIEFKILLSTGGPALRIIGDLSKYNQLENPTLQWQDWGTPWTTYNPTFPDTEESDWNEALDWYCGCFCFEC
jgi:hypothetical protein